MKFDLSGVNFQRHFSPYSARRGCEHSLYMSLMPLKKKSNGCFPMRKFHENRKFDISPLGLLCSTIMAGHSVQSQRATQQQSQQSQSVGKN